MIRTFIFLTFILLPISGFANPLNLSCESSLGTFQKTFTLSDNEMVDLGMIEGHEVQVQSIFPPSDISIMVSGKGSDFGAAGSLDSTKSFVNAWIHLPTDKFGIECRLAKFPN